MNQGEGQKKLMKFAVNRDLEKKVGRSDQAIKDYIAMNDGSDP